MELKKIYTLAKSKGVSKIDIDTALSTFLSVALMQTLEKFPKLSNDDDKKNMLTSLGEKFNSSSNISQLEDFTNKVSAVISDENTDFLLLLKENYFNLVAELYSKIELME